jgi:hypothetical protein
MRFKRKQSYSKDCKLLRTDVFIMSTKVSRGTQMFQKCTKMFKRGCFLIKILRKMT